MDWASVVQNIVSGAIPLISALLGGGLALAGAWWTQSARIQAERRQRRAEKYEEIVTALFELDHWLDNLTSSQAFGKGTAEGTSPFAKVEAIAAVYFPELASRVRDLDQARLHYTLWIHQAAGKRLKGELATLTEGFQETLKPYQTAVHELKRAIGEMAAKELS